MTMRGGCTVLLTGKPDGHVHVPPAADALSLPRRSRRFNFSVLCVKDNQKVQRGTVLALDPSSFSVPLLSPIAGTVSTTREPGHIRIEGDPGQQKDPDRADFDFPHAPRTADSKGKIRYQILRNGAWQFMRDVFTGRLPDPAGVPQAVIVSTMHLEPFTARGDVQIRERLASFTRGLEHLQSLLEYQPIYLVFPKINSAFAQKVRDTLRGYAWVRLTEATTTYPADDFALVARSLKLQAAVDKGVVWGIRTEGVIAIDRAVSSNEPSVTRTIAVGGPGAPHPTHIEVPVGYPIEKIRSFSTIAGANRIVSGGVFTGTTVGPEHLGVDAECDGLTVIPDPVKREFLSFMWPGFSKRSYSRTFASVLRGPFAEKHTTALRGEHRPCISCGFCSDVCPARIVPSAIHKLLYRDSIDEVEFFRPDRCIGCGLCSFVCPSKIELADEISRVRERIWQETNTAKK